MKIYKIIDNKTGLFSGGGYNPYFSKNGKFWSAPHFATSSLMHLDASIDTSSWEVVEYELTEVGRTSVASIYKEKKEKKLKTLLKKMDGLKVQLESYPKEVWTPKHSQADEAQRVYKQYENAIEEYGKAQR